MDDNKATGLVSSMQHFSLGDGPGIRTTIFLDGCNLHCGWCHNPETWTTPSSQLLYYKGRCRSCGQCVTACPTGAHRLDEKRHTFDRSLCVRCGRCVETCPAGALEWTCRQAALPEVMAYILEDLPFYGESGGVTLSGGEPLLQPEFCRMVAASCRKEGISVVLDTAASVPYTVIEPLQEFVDIFYIDVKGVDDMQCRERTGADLSLVLDNMTRLVQAGAVVSARIPVIPDYSDTADYAVRLAKRLVPTGVQRVDLLPFHRLGSGKYQALDREYDYGQVQPPEKERLEAMAEMLRQAGFIVSVGS